MVGFRVLGRFSELGRVVDVREDPDGSEVVVVRGGVSGGLVFYIPASSILSRSASTRTLRVDLEFAEFVPQLQADGTIELRTSS